jgi:RNA polymerase sigma factor (TIGR02999 family)
MGNLQMSAADTSDIGADKTGSTDERVRLLANDLVPVFFEQLKRIAHRERWRVNAGSTLQTTALVSEAYLKLRGSEGWNDDAHFLRAAALAMRHALLNHAEARVTAKRGAGAIHVPLTEAKDISSETDRTLLALNDALQRLAQHSKRLADVVECRYFGGYDEPSTARALGISERTARRDWALARAWLHRELEMELLSE